MPCPSISDPEHCKLLKESMTPDDCQKKIFYDSLCTFYKVEEGKIWVLGSTWAFEFYQLEQIVKGGLVVIQETSTFQ